MIRQLFNRIRGTLWFLPGFLLWAAFPPMGEAVDVLFALAPLMWLSRQGNMRLSARRWFQSGIFFWLATLSWMPAIVKNGGPWPLVVLGWGALALYCAAYFAAYGALSGFYWRWANARHPVWRVLGILAVEPILWSGLELIRSRFLGGFSWNQLGVVPVNSGFGAPAALGGVYLLSTVMILINGSIAGIVERMVSALKKHPLPRLRSLETLLIFLVVWGIYQIPTVAKGTSDAPPESLKVALVQRNFPCVFKGREENPYSVYGKLLESVSPLRPDLVVLSESAMCEFGPVDQQGAMKFATFVREQSGAALLAGGTRFADGKTYNSAALYGKNDDLQTYDKVHLVPFGEFIPGDKLIPALQKLAPVGSCTPGEPKVLRFGSTSLGIAICFEDTDSALMRDYARKGARALVFITNDSWFSESNETVAHAWQATARAVETGFPVIRVGNSGVTGTITPTGQRTWLLRPDGRALVDHSGTMFDRMELPSAHLTPYVRFGDKPLFFAFALLIGGLILIKYRDYVYE